MGSLWRSQPMGFYELFLQTESSYESVSALGELGLVQFEDLNPEISAYQRKYVNEIRRCEEMERKLRFFEKEIGKAKLHVGGAETAIHSAAPEISEMQQMENAFEKLEHEMKEINSNEENLKKQELELIELREILGKTGQFFDEAEHSASFSDDTHRTPLLESDRGESQLGFVTGVIPRDKSVGFELLLWRACRGNVFLRKVSIETPFTDPVTGKEVLKDVFIVFFQGGQLEQRVVKICEGYEATIYPCPDKAPQRREVADGVITRIDDLRAVLRKTNEHRCQVLAEVALKLRGWMVKVKKIKAIFHILNLFKTDLSRKCLVAHCWCPIARLDDIHNALRLGTERSGSTVPAILNPIKAHKKPPTYHVTNKFTSGFQTIVDAYGVASYLEVNPAPFTIITFPFLFAVMFGDFGHGFLMALAAFWVIRNEVRLKNFEGGEIWNTMYGGRYIILLMGLFSIYTGFIYNDIFSKSVTFASSGWNLPNTTELVPGEEEVDLVAYNHGYPTNFDHAYVLGVDPVWMISENKLIFTNSYKMKLSVLLGIIHMIFGVCLGYFNHTFFKRPLRVYFEFIPQLLFITCIFGYLCIMIIFKWCSSWETHNPPSLLLMLINMFLKFTGNIESSEVLYGSADGKTQHTIQQILVIIAVLCVPVMLLVNPLVLRHRHNKKAQQLPQHHEEEEDDGHGPFNFGEIFVHQAIHTIEYCLGCISNTASYLRLWALSLAHGQLSEVLWTMVLHNGFKNFFFMFCAFAVWAALTVAVLLIMEGLSAFLHALRLHWVEFNNKFYEGNGYLFAPFSFEKILSAKEE